MSTSIKIVEPNPEQLKNPKELYGRIVTKMYINTKGKKLSNRGK